METVESDMELSWSLIARDHGVDHEVDHGVWFGGANHEHGARTTG